MFCATNITYNISHVRIHKRKENMRDDVICEMRIISNDNILHAYTYDDYEYK